MAGCIDQQPDSFKGTDCCLVLGTGKLSGLCSRQQAACGRHTPINMGCPAGRVGCQPLAAAAEGHALDDCWGDAAQQLEDVNSCGQGHALAAGAGGADPAGRQRVSTFLV